MTTTKKTNCTIDISGDETDDMANYSHMQASSEVNYPQLDNCNYDGSIALTVTDHHGSDTLIKNFNTTVGKSSSTEILFLSKMLEENFCSHQLQILSIPVSSLQLLILNYVPS